MSALVAILMGSPSDLPVMRQAAEVLAAFEVPHEVRILSAHRSPSRLASYLNEADSRGIRVIIAGAGLAAHLAGVTASLTRLPVIGVPLANDGAPLGGLDALLSTVQMPPGVPVATVGLNGARNAAHLTVRILALHEPELAARLAAYRESLEAQIGQQDAELQEKGLEVAREADR